MIKKQDSLEFHDDEVVRANIEDNFSMLPVLMLTLTQFITLDSVAGINGPLVMTSGTWCLLLGQTHHPPYPPS